MNSPLIRGEQSWNTKPSSVGANGLKPANILCNSRSKSSSFDAGKNKEDPFGGRLEHRKERPDVCVEAVKRAQELFVKSGFRQDSSSMFFIWMHKQESPMQSKLSLLRLRLKLI
nr:hypothetical protein [Tanacetum cinerariifolium]